MADAKKCDFCGRYFTLTTNKYDFNKIIYWNNEVDKPVSADPKDVCRKCMKKIFKSVGVEYDPESREDVGNG